MIEDVLLYFWYLSIILQVLFSLHLILPFALFITSYFTKYINGDKVGAKKYIQSSKLFKFGIIITAHQETTFIPPIIDSFLKQTYTNFEVYVVADCCDISDMQFSDTRVHILKPPVPLNTNTKSIQYAINNFTSDIEVMVIFDPDNLVHPEFLSILNNYYKAGYKAVQGNLSSKVTKGNYEKMDSVGAIFYNFIDRDVRSMLGLSVNTWGCGVSVLTEVYKKICYDSKSTMGGFDKHMQAEIAKNIPVIGYAADAILYDEKISNSRSLETQRIRWINAYFNFLQDGFNVLFLGIKRFNFNLAFFGFNLIRPPYFLQIITALLFIAVNALVSHVMFVYWICTLGLFLISFTAIILLNADKAVATGLLYMPLFFFHQVRSLFQLRLNKRSILKTEHSRILYIDDLLKK